MAQSAEFQNMNRILKLQDKILQQSQFVEQIQSECYPWFRWLYNHGLLLEKNPLLVSLLQESIFLIIMILKLKQSNVWPISKSVL